MWLLYTTRHLTSYLHPTPQNSHFLTEIFSILYPWALRQIWAPHITGKSLPNWNPSRSVSLSFAEWWCRWSFFSTTVICSKERLQVVVGKRGRKAWGSFQSRGGSEILSIDFPCCASHSKTILPRLLSVVVPSQTWSLRSARFSLHLIDIYWVLFGFVELH